MENNIIINGDVYLKKRPEEFDLELEEFDYRKPLNVESFYGKPMDDFYFAMQEELIPYNQFGDFNYSGMDEFWQISVNNDGTFSMIMNDKLDIEKKYNTIEEVNRDFIKVTDFLNNATFVGRMFRRTSPIMMNGGKCNSDYYDDENFDYIVLFATPDILLAKSMMKKHHFMDRYEIISAPFFEDGKYEYYGPVHEEYRDKRKTYADILKYCSDFNKRYRGTK